MQAGFTVWLTGLSGAGKSTIANLLGDYLRGRGHLVEILDGDEIRKNLNKELGFSKHDRDVHVRRIGHVARLLSRNGVVSIVAAISPYRDVRCEIRREHETRFVEVFVSCPMDELLRRDPKGLYAKAAAGQIENFTGISDTYEPPLFAELTIWTHLETPPDSVGRIVMWLRAQKLIQHNT